MLFLILQIIALVIAGLMVGNELAVSAFVHPQLRRLDDATHLASVRALARVYGAVMPIWYGLTLVLTVAIALILYLTSSTWPWAVASAGLWLVSIVLTLASLVPINHQVSQWQVETLPPNWKALRNCWDSLHQVRVGILAIALVCLINACLLH